MKPLALIVATALLCSTSAQAKQSGIKCEVKSHNRVDGISPWDSNSTRYYLLDDAAHTLQVRTEGHFNDLCAGTFVVCDIHYTNSAVTWVRQTQSANGSTNVSLTLDRVTGTLTDSIEFTLASGRKISAKSEGTCAPESMAPKF